ncbi:MAG: 6,7-dimethyl-8-ribityllumazine synthase [Alphaproteobacteria bacterium]|nr:6,7-dimethyl-8-ribityllumazine synthase [Alphaproteobacteria bacterium]
MENNRPPVIFKFDNPPHVAIIEARYYGDIADLQLRGVTDVLARAGATHEIIAVPGALEIPAAIGFLIKAMDFDPVRRRPDGYIALGCVLKGGTMHDEIVAMESARGLQELALAHNIAIGNGILTCNTREQAIERADPAKLNRGGEAAEAALRMIELKHQLRLSPKRRWVAKS